MIDRLGSDKGKFAALDGTPFEQRALPPSSVNHPTYVRYEVLMRLPGDVLEGRAHPWFEQPGGGLQYYFPKSMEWYVNNGYIRELGTAARIGDI